MESNSHEEATRASPASDWFIPNSASAVPRWLIAILAFGLVNFVAGELGLLLAIPPGFATAVFPPSGIALAGLLIWGIGIWPGILIGSIAFNLHLSLGSSPDATLLGALPIAASIATGSTLQALVAVHLVRRFSREPTRLILESDVIRLLLLGGPVSCLVAASWGVGTLFLGGLHAEGTLVYTWFTWWVGDTIGVLIFAPLVFSLFAQPRSLWRPRLLAVSLPLIVAFTLVVMVYVVVSHRSDEAIASDFRDRVEILDRGLDRSLQSHAEILWSIRSYFAGSQDVNEDEFATFVKRSLSAYPGLKALAWSRYISHAERANYEREGTRAMGRPFEILSRGAEGRLERAPDTEEHVFVQYIEPRAGNEAAIGFDIFSEPLRRSAIERARDTGEPAVSQRIALVQDPTGGYSYLLILPIYETDATPATIDARRAGVRGYAVAVIQIETLIDTALAGLPTDGIEILVRDESAPIGDRLLAQRPYRPPSVDPDPSEEAYGVTLEHVVGGRSWSFQFSPSARYLLSQPTWQAWAVLALGLGCTGLLGALLLVITGRAVLETERRAEIAGMNSRLKHTNEELAGFAYAASHDLRSPLRGVSQLAEFIVLDHADSMPAEAREHLDLMRDRIARMIKLLDDLLEYSQVGWLNEKTVRVDTSELVSEIAALLVGDGHFSVRGVDLPEISTVAVPLEQVLLNLCSNSIKHHDRESGEIEVHCVEEPEHFVFAVRDDGPGISKEDQERVFEMFRRGTTQGEGGGNGMGLALVRKIVSNAGGTVWIESGDGRGTTIYFTWPK